MTTHRISEQDIAYDAMATLEEWFRGYRSISDGREYKLVQIEHGESQMMVEVRSTSGLDVEEDQFEVEIIVRRVKQ